VANSRQPRCAAQSRSNVTRSTGVRSLGAISSTVDAAINASQSIPRPRMSHRRAAAPMAKRCEWVMDPTNPSGQIGARSEPIPISESCAYPARRSACMAQYRPAMNPASRRGDAPRNAGGTGIVNASSDIERIASGILSPSRISAATTWHSAPVRSDGTTDRRNTDELALQPPPRTINRTPSPSRFSRALSSPALR